MFQLSCTSILLFKLNKFLTCSIQDSWDKRKRSIRAKTSVSRNTGLVYRITEKFLSRMKIHKRVLNFHIWTHAGDSCFRAYHRSRLCNLMLLWCQKVHPAHLIAIWTYHTGLEGHDAHFDITLSGCVNCVYDCVNCMTDGVE